MTDIDSGTVDVSFPAGFTVLDSISVLVSTLSVDDRITFVVGGRYPSDQHIC